MRQARITKMLCPFLGDEIFEAGERAGAKQITRRTTVSATGCRIVFAGTVGHCEE